MSDLDWFDEYECEARRACDIERVQLGQLHRLAYSFRETGPDQALALIAEGRRLAVALREPWWVLYYDQQRVHALLHFQQDYRDVLDLAVRTALELRKPAFAAFPRRLLIHGDLVSAYLGIDPVGYAGPVRQALEYLDGEVPAEGDDRYLLLGSQRQFALEVGDLAEGERLTRRSLDLAAADGNRSRARHFLVFAYSGLAEIAWRKGDFGQLDEVARLGEELAARVGHKVEHAGMQLWRALVARRAGREAEAAAIHRHAVARLHQFGMIPDCSYRDAECAFHEEADHLDRALCVREAELAAIRDRGRLAYECACRIKRAWLLRRLGALTGADEEVARESARRLREPAAALARIDRVERGEGAMTIWDWARDFERRARAEGDLERARLAHVHTEAYSHRQTNPDRMLAVLDEGRALAQRLGEPWWVLFFEHWKLETLIYYKDDYRQVIDLAVRATLELRKPAFEQYPLRFGIYCNLVAAYLCVDPRGYAAAIREALVYLQAEVSPDGEDRYLVQARRHWFAYEIGELAEAWRLALEELAMADADPDRHTARHHEVDTYKALCWIAFHRQDWQGLRDCAGTGEARARAIDYRYELALFLLWQALSARRAKDEEQARRLCRQGTAQMARLGQPPGESYYDALAAYHEQGENTEAAWEVRKRELETTVGKGQLAYECLVHLKRVRLLVKMGRPAREETEAVRQAAARLREPGWYLEQLEKALGESG